MPTLDIDRINSEDHADRKHAAVKGRRSATMDPGEALSLLARQKTQLHEPLEGVDKFTASSIVTLFGGLLLLMASGLAYALGTISPYIVSYFRMYCRYDVNYDTFYPLQALTEISCSCTYPVANFLVVAVFNGRSRPALSIGAVLGIGLLCLCVVIEVPPYAFIVMYAVGAGLVKGFYKQCSLVAGWSHLGARKGLVSGIILGGYGVGGSLYGLYYQRNIDQLNEEPVEDVHDGNLYFDKSIGARYPEIHKQVCLIMLVVSVIAIAMVSNYVPPTTPAPFRARRSSFHDMTPAKRERLTVLGNRYGVRRNQGDDHHPASETDSLSGRDVQHYERQIEKDLADELEAEEQASTFKLLLSNKFLLIYVMSVTQFMYPIYFDVIFKEIGQHYIDDDALLTKIGSIAQACNSVGRVLTGFALDYVSAKKANYAILAVMVAQILTLHIAVRHWQLYLYACMAIMGAEGAYTSLQAVLIMQQFGLKRGPEIFAY